MNDISEKSVWIFTGQGGRFPSAVFRELEDAERWIKLHKLTGVLTLYPLDQGIYDWAIDKGYFSPQKESQQSPEFIGAFSSASQNHYHYEDGELES